MLPTSAACTQAPNGFTSFDEFTRLMSHEVVETISDPAGFGMGNGGFYELGDNCEGKPDGYTTVDGFSLSRYWSNFDNNCQPRLDPPAGSTTATWVLGQGSPLQRFTGSVHTLTLGVPPGRVATDAPATQVVLMI